MEHLMNDRAEPVLATTLERLVETGTLTRAQADAVRADFRADQLVAAPADAAPTVPAQERPGSSRPPQEPPDASWSLLLTEVGGYIGAAFVVAAAMALVGSNWEQFSVAGRVGLLTGPAAFLLLAAVALRTSAPGGASLRDCIPTGHTHLSAETDHLESGPRRRLISALILAAGGLLGAAAAVLSEDTGPDRWIPLVPLMVWGLGYLLCRGIVLHLGAAGALTWTCLTVLDTGGDYRWASGGLLLVAAAAVWAALAARKLVEERTLGTAVAGVMAFIGGESVVASDHEALGYLLLGLIAVAGFTGYIRTRELSALGVGATALAITVPQTVIDYTEGSLNAAGGLLISGLSVVAASVLAGRLRRVGSGPTKLV
jgi:predicted membrane protein DUF2157